MGLTVEIGSLAYCLKHDQEGAVLLRDEFEKCNEALRQDGLPAHREPENVPVESLDYRGTLGQFSYSNLHLLRRVAAYRFRNKDWTVADAKFIGNPLNDIVLDEIASNFESDLLCHSDSKGFFVPVDNNLGWVICSDLVEGGFVGSSQKLLRELVQIAPALNLQLNENGEMSEDVFYSIQRAAYSECPFWQEYIAWQRLFICAKLSILYNSAIRFC